MKTWTSQLQHLQNVLHQFQSGNNSCLAAYPSGLETMHLLTQAKNYELRVDMEDFDGQSVFAQYSSFSVGPEAEGYKLSLGGFVKGAAGLYRLFSKTANYERILPI